MEREYGIFNYISCNPISSKGSSKEKIKKPSLS